jgi:hypothetical protein
VRSEAGKLPQDQCRELVSYYFDRRNVPPSLLGILMELMAVATHDPELLGRMREQAHKFKTFLKQTFRKPSAAMSTDDAATMAAAIWMGLLVNSPFDPTLTTPRGGCLTLKTLSLLGGFEES